MGLRHPVEIGLVGDVGATLAALLPKLKRRTTREFLARCQQGVKAWHDTLERVEAQQTTPLKPQFVVAAVSRCLTDDAIISLDTGAHTIFCGRHLRVKATHSLAVSGTLASMGVGLPYALAAKLAYRGRLVGGVSRRWRLHDGDGRPDHGGEVRAGGEDRDLQKQQPGDGCLGAERGPGRRSLARTCTPSIL